MLPGPAPTLEVPAPGILLAQPRRGYRYSVDAFWLAGFALEQVETGRALDLCTGSGIVAYLLASRGLITTGIDVQPAWAELWRHSRAENPVDLHVADARTWQGSYDLVTCNPPFNAAGSGPISPDPVRAAARTELNGTLIELWTAAMKLSRGWVVFVLPTRRVVELPRAVRQVDLGELTLLAWGPGAPEHRQLDREAAGRWVERLRSA